MKQSSVDSSLYDTDYYKKYNHGYDYFKEENASLMPYFVKRFDKINFTNKKVLDIGCGRGELLKYIIKNNGIAVGIDYSEDAVSISKETVGNSKGKYAKNSEVYRMDAKALRFPNNEFDYIFMLDIVEHLHDWELKKALKEAARILKPTGTIIIHTSPNKNLLNVVRVITKVIGMQLKSEKYHVNEQTAKTLKNYTKDHFEGRILAEKVRTYWYSQMVFRGKLVKTIAKLLDLLTDAKLVHNILSSKPFLTLFATDLWFYGKKRR